MDCWNRFDRKVVLYYTGYPERVPVAESEIKKAGIDDVYRQYSAPSVLDEIALSKIKHEYDVTPSYFNLTAAHYRAIASSYYLGCDSVLIMEDDIAFLKDLDTVEHVVRSLPLGFDVALFDWFSYNNIVKRFDKGVFDASLRENSVNTHWSRFSFARSNGCYALSRRAMKHYMFLIDAVITSPKIGEFRVVDHFLDRRYFPVGYSLMVANPHVAIQRKFEKNLSQRNGIQEQYANYEIDFSKYT